MNISIKTVDKTEYHVLINEKYKTKDVKKELSELYNFDIERQTLIYLGKILEDEQEIYELNITEKGFIVLLLSKQKKQHNKPVISENIESKNNKNELLKNDDNSPENDNLQNNISEGTQNNVDNNLQNNENQESLNNVDDDLQNNENHESLNNADNDLQNNENQESLNNADDNLQNNNESEDDNENISDEKLNEAVDRFIKMVQKDPVLLTDLIQSQSNADKIATLINKIGEKDEELGKIFINNINEFFLLVLNKMGNILDSSVLNYPLNNFSIPQTEINNQEYNLNEEQQKVLDNLKNLFPNTDIKILYESLIVCNYNEEMAANYLFDTLNSF